MNDYKIQKYSGTYSFCEGCNDHCCNKVKPNGRIEVPILLSGEVKKIEALSKENKNKFSILKKGLGKGVRAIRTDSKGCYFYRHGKCDIYDARPLDCRIFPFDIIENDGRLTLIGYKSLSPFPLSKDLYVQNLEKAESVLPFFKEDIFTYARMLFPVMDREPFIELAEIQISDGVFQGLIPLESYIANSSFSANNFSGTSATVS